MLHGVIKSLVLITTQTEKQNKVGRLVGLKKLTDKESSFLISLFTQMIKTFVADTAKLDI